MTDITCGTNADIRRIYYRFTYSSMNNQIFNVTVYVLTSTNAANMRINVEWIDIYNSTESTTTIPGSLICSFASYCPVKIDMSHLLNINSFSWL